MDYLKRSNTPINIKVIGIGGGGNNAVSKMLNDEIVGVEFILANTDAQFLEMIECDNKLILGKKLTKGLGAGSDPEIGEKASKESYDELKAMFEGADLVFVTAGLGGGTGTGGAPVIAAAAKEAGALVIATVTTPFAFEGKKREMFAKEGLLKIDEQADAIILIENEKILKQLSNIPIKQAFSEADRILEQTVKTIVDLVTVPGIINLDFADVKTVLKNKGRIHIGIGIAEGENRAKRAAYESVNSGIINPTIDGATDSIVNITGGPSLTLSEANEVVNLIKQEAGTDLNVIFGFATTETLGDKVIVTTIAAGFDKEHENSIQEIQEEKTSEETVIQHAFEDSLDENIVQESEHELDESMENIFFEDFEVIPEIEIESEIESSESELDELPEKSEKSDVTISDDDLPSFLRKVD